MKAPIRVEVNGKVENETVEAATPLVDFLRHRLGLTGAHVGCRSASCGACTVLLEDRVVKSCCVLAAEADGCSVRTVENGPDNGLDDVQQAFVDCQGMQCGFCTPGMVVSVRALLDRNPNPTRDQARHAIAGNLCRCTGYTNILNAIDTVAQRRRNSLMD
ncbi:(2Fe-2S)-binding protein (plasmid) [Rhodococcus globerulus]|uniref:(2Fe-2S)-binding protein n=1 Tax=Rhodococcus globerulus TaxID=33008 RepID=UPI0039ECC899